MDTGLNDKSFTWNQTEWLQPLFNVLSDRLHGSVAHLNL